MEKGEKITLCVKKRTPSLNTLLGMNRWARVKEKREMQRAAMLAIESALLAEGSGSATRTTWLGESSSLRSADIIPEDDPKSITLEVSQEKVKTYKEEETWVEVSVHE